MWDSDVAVAAATAWIAAEKGCCFLRESQEIDRQKAVGSFDLGEKQRCAIGGFACTWRRKGVSGYGFGLGARGC
jgi:hypothetical protein